MVRFACLAIVFAIPMLAAPVDVARAVGVFRCEARGRVVYQDKPCMPGESERDLDVEPANVSVIPSAIDAPSARTRASRPERAAKTKPPTKAERRRVDGERRHGEAEVAERRHVKEGSSDGEVLARLGPPDLQSGKGGRSSRWTYLPTTGDPQTVTLVRFEEGRVVAVERKVLLR